MKTIFVLLLAHLFSQPLCAKEPDKEHSELEYLNVNPKLFDRIREADKELIESVREKYEPKVGFYLQKRLEGLPEIYEDEVNKLKELMKTDDSVTVKGLHDALVAAKQRKQYEMRSKALIDPKKFEENRIADERLLDNVDKFLKARSIKAKLKTAAPGSALDEAFKGAKNIYDEKERIAILESVYDQGLVGLYLQKKMEGLLETKEFCSAAQKCAEGGSGTTGGGNAPKGMNDLFHRKPKEQTQH